MSNAIRKLFFCLNCDRVTLFLQHSASNANAKSYEYNANLKNSVPQYKYWIRLCTEYGVWCTILILLHIPSIDVTLCFGCSFGPPAFHCLVYFCFQCECDAISIELRNVSACQCTLYNFSPKWICFFTFIVL